MRKLQLKVKKHLVLCSIITLCVGFLIMAFPLSGYTINSQTSNKRALKLTSKQLLGTQQPNLENPQTFRAHDKTLHVARQPKIPVSIIGVKNLEKDFLKDWEIEVKNHSGKPIYYLALTLRFPKLPKNEDGRVYLMGLDFGNNRLSNPIIRATPDDPFIEPYGKHTFKVPELESKGLEMDVTRRALHPRNVNSVIVDVTLVSFGDGTGYIAGEYFPAIRESGNNHQLREADNIKGLGMRVKN